MIKLSGGGNNEVKQLTKPSSMTKLLQHKSIAIGSLFSGCTIFDI